MRFKKIILLFFIFLIIFIYPSFSNATEPTINSKSAILVEPKTGKIIYEKNSTSKMYPASTTKIMTAILALENCDLNQKIRVTASALENIPSGYVTLNLSIGEELTLKDLLYALMVPSANDAAFVIAEYIGGSTEAFANMMNTKAIELGCTSTHFVNPNGIHDDSHYTTAYDLYLIAKYAMKNEEFRKIVSTTSYTLPATNKYSLCDRKLSTTNLLINPASSKYYYKYAIGIKTGYTLKAGECLVSMATRDDLSFICVTLGGDELEEGNSRYIDTKKLLDYGYDNYTLTKLKEKGNIIETIEIKNATKETKNLNICISESITALKEVQTSLDTIEPEITLKGNLEAPISAGDIVGTIKYKVCDIEYSANLYASTDVLKKEINYYYIIACIFLLLLLCKILSTSKNNRKK